jgi:hypothetical protein
MLHGLNAPSVFATHDPRNRLNELEFVLNMATRLNNTNDLSAVIVGVLIPVPVVAASPVITGQSECRHDGVRRFQNSADTPCTCRQMVVAAHGRSMLRRTVLLLEI